MCYLLAVKHLKDHDKIWWINPVLYRISLSNDTERYEAKVSCIINKIENFTWLSVRYFIVEKISVLFET